MWYQDIMNAPNGDLASMESEISGRQQFLQRELERYLSLLIGRPELDRIIVFGSMAAGPMHSWSDIDLVIVQRTELPFLQRIHEVRRLLRPRVATDFLIYTPDEFGRLCRERPFFQSEILGRGRVVYDRSR